ncbi:SMI1/KNR4 family protein [Paenibacillus sp. JW14]|uniref:SMI1/KNR4 family protein n=2 Tax=Paenibacillus agri TaxID=2744309 RepID=A0A850EW25_9BACL|nr:SMI1/KNR4 family protein [Paenibacillus agri]
MMKHKLDTWKRQWQWLVQALEQKGASTFITIDPPAPEREIAEAESRLRIQLPEEFRSLLKDGSGKVLVYWSLPCETIKPFDVSGEIGWGTDQLCFSDFADEEMEGQRRYLTFHVAGNGDELLLDLGSPSGTSVVHWAHETAEFRLLAPSITAFVDRVTELGCVGAEEWQYPYFCGEFGLDLESGNSKRWKAWLNQYLTLSLEQAQEELPLLITYTEMNGVDKEVAAAFARYDGEAVLQAWLKRASAEQDPNQIESLMCFAGDVLKEKAADVVRSLWSEAPAVKVSPSTRAYLSARCLPEGEGLNQVLEMLDVSAKQNKLSGYEANSLLQHFGSRRVLEWMEEKVSFPYNGWDTLYVHSQPSVSDILHWLSGKDVQRQIVISALSSLPEDYVLFHSDVDAQQVRSLLEQALDTAVLKKEKQVIRKALERLA